MPETLDPCVCNLSDIISIETDCNEPCDSKGITPQVFFTCTKDVMSVPGQVNCTYNGDIMLYAGKRWYELTKIDDTASSVKYTIPYKSNADGSVVLYIWGDEADVTCAITQMQTAPLDLLIPSACGQMRHYTNVTFEISYDSGFVGDAGKVGYTLTGKYTGGMPPYYTGAI